MELSNISVILVKTIHPGNIGSVVRAMKNMGMKDLVLIDPCEFDHEETKKMSVGDDLILKKVKVHDDLKEVLRAFQWTVATTRRDRRRFSHGMSPEEIAKKIWSFSGSERVALVFGPEDRGLSNQDLSLCQAVSTIDAAPLNPSLNLAQAVMVYLYQIYQARPRSRQRRVSEKEWAGVREMEGMYRHFFSMLEELKYFNRGRPETLMQSIRSFLNRASLSHRDVRILRGICSSVIRKIKTK